MRFLNVLISFLMVLPAQFTMLPRAIAGESTAKASAAPIADAAKTLSTIGTFHHFLGLLRVEASAEDRAFIDEQLKAADVPLPKYSFNGQQFKMNGFKYPVDFSNFAKYGSLTIDGHEFVFKEALGLRGNLSQLEKFFVENKMDVADSTDKARGSAEGFNLFKRAHAQSADDESGEKAAATARNSVARAAIDKGVRKAYTLAGFVVAGAVIGGVIGGVAANFYGAGLGVKYGATAGFVLGMIWNNTAGANELPTTGPLVCPKKENGYKMSYGYGGKVDDVQFVPPKANAPADVELVPASYDLRTYPSQDRKITEANSHEVWHALVNSRWQVDTAHLPANAPVKPFLQDTARLLKDLAGICRKGQAAVDDFNKEVSAMLRGQLGDQGSAAIGVPPAAGASH